MVFDYMKWYLHTYEKNHQPVMKWYLITNYEWNTLKVLIMNYMNYLNLFDSE